jgi:type II secretory pathway component GspD/PulD (secretin)
MARGALHGNAGFALAALLIASSTAREQDPSDVGPHMVLVQSELDYLTAAESRLTLIADDIAVREILRAIGKRTGLEIRVRSKLPETKLDVKFENVTAREALTWLSREVDLVYKAEPPVTLGVYARPTKSGQPKE